MTQNSFNKIRAIFFAFIGTCIPSIIAGGIVGLFFLSSFWYWTLGIALLTFLYACLDRIPIRLFTGAMKGLPLGGLLKYGYTSTDKRPVPTDVEVEDRQRFNIYSYDHFYGDRDK